MSNLQAIDTNEHMRQLPVMEVADHVVASVREGKPSLLAAPTGSGKSMVVPTKLAAQSPHMVLVLVPRRFLAIDAASNVAQLTGTTLGQEVGYAVGKSAGDVSQKSDGTQLLFATYGYALRSGLINSAKTVVLDEVHEADSHIALARAVLHKRKQREPNLQILEMSATLDAQKQAQYWGTNTAIFSVDKSQLTYDEFDERPDEEQGLQKLEERAIDLMKHGLDVPSEWADMMPGSGARNGMLIFRPGVREVEETAGQLRKLADKAGLKKLEIATIHGGSTPDERDVARAAPLQGWKKILVGTNVIESGVTLPWVDSGISDGVGKVNYHRHETGADALVAEHLPEWRLTQQRGRVNRSPATTGFTSGLFILHSDYDRRLRRPSGTPEIKRIALDELAFHAASLGHNPEQLTFDPPLNQAHLQQAKENLMRLQLLHDNWSLTKDGIFAASLPLPPSGLAMLCEARRIASRPRIRGEAPPPPAMQDAILLAALGEVKDFRLDWREGHGLDETSDLIDRFKAFREISYSRPARIMETVTDEVLTNAPTEELNAINQHRDALRETCADHNVSYNAFREATRLVHDIEDRVYKKERSQKDKDAYHAHPYNAARYDAMKQCILNGHMNRVFQKGDDGMLRDLLRDSDRNRRQSGLNYHYAKADASEVNLHGTEPLVVGQLRETADRSANGGPRARPELGYTTAIPAHVLLSLASDPQRHYNPLSEVSHDCDMRRQGRGNQRQQAHYEMTARFADNALFTIPIPKMSPAIEAQLRTVEKPHESLHGSDAFNDDAEWEQETAEGDHYYGSGHSHRQRYAMRRARAPREWEI